MCFFSTNINTVKQNIFFFLPLQRSPPVLVIQRWFVLPGNLSFFFITHSMASVCLRLCNLSNMVTPSITCKGCSWAPSCGHNGNEQEWMKCRHTQECTTSTTWHWHSLWFQTSNVIEGTEGSTYMFSTESSTYMFHIHVPQRVPHTCSPQFISVVSADTLYNYIACGIYPFHQTFSSIAT